ncbi:hypothetical protein [Paracoccus fistulariae]|uniref:Uncharacterized protein n=1 Tax=Paracoccus fistulariae TaxID=658446 RepID=A0ABY7SH06_9RHOB|nr:hypothetical protein [Paracoccus fistulariae]MDB6180988.1 hypothetical protein [Paracoccus fistulariae]WCR06284.1 hypothetical protein JHX87_12360 [Paracoccus fistulariae]
MPRTATKPKLIFHIGHHKTGSTSIQEAFATGKIHLPGKQILYPTRLNHNYLRPQVDAFARDGKVMPGNAEKPGPARIGQMLQDGAWDYAVISGEEFEGAKPAELQQTIQHFWQPHISDHLVICYVRPHAGRTLSTFAEDIKIGRFADTPERYHQKMLREGRLLYQRKLTPWTRTFGQNFRVRPMIRDELRNKSAVEDFIAQTFGDDADNIRLLPLTASNESLCIEDLMLLKLVHRQLRDRTQWIRHNIGWEVARLAADEGLTAQRTKPALHKALAQQISRDYHDDARWMDAEFFGGRPVLLRDLESSVDQAIPKAQSYDPKDYFSGQALRAINTMARLTEAMLDNGKSNWGGFLMQRRLNALHEDAKGDGPQPAATKEPADKPQNTVSVQMIDNAVAMRDDDPQRLNNISRRLNNAFLNVKPANVDLTLDQVLDRMDQATPQMRDVLNEFLVQLFFHQHAKTLTPRLLRNRTLRDIAKSDPAVGRMVEYLSADPGIAPHLLTAGEYYLRGQLKPAYAEFDRARQLLLQQGNLRHHNRGLLALRDLDCLARWADEGPDPVLPAMQFTSDKPFDTALPITVIGLDGGYFSRYGRRLIETSAGRSNLHFHVINAGDAQLIDAPNIRYSTEDAPDATNGYYAISRFLRLPALLDRYGMPLMTSDADAFFHGSPASAFAAGRGADIVLTATKGRDNQRGYLAAVPWRHVMGGVLIANPSQGAQQYLRIFGRLYAGLTRDAGAPQWWVDQALLSATADLAKLRRLPIKVAYDWLFPKSGMKQSKI